MARSILGIKSPNNTLAALSPIRDTVRATLTGAALQARLRQKRSSAYIDTLTRLDAGGHVHSPTATQALIDAIKAELPEVSVDALPHGIVSRCYLGAPYEVHTLDCSGSIIEHYKNHQSLPALLERARTLALHPGYAFIEVYAQRLIAVSDSGQTSIIEL